VLEPLGGDRCQLRALLVGPLGDTDEHRRLRIRNLDAERLEDIKSATAEIERMGSSSACRFTVAIWASVKSISVLSATRVPATALTRLDSAVAQNR
jgi:hypothetical protein